MVEEKWRDPNLKVLNFRYMSLSLLATILVAAGAVGYFKPDFLAWAGGDVKKLVHSYWFLLVGAGLVIGIANAFVTFTTDK